MRPAKTIKTLCQGMTASSPSASTGPTTCPPEPAAVAMPSASERCSFDAARPTMARITPKPVPAMPNPTRISRTWCWPGVMARAESTSPAE
jgi:hypothetical protein